MTLVYSAECKAIQKSESKGMLPILIVLFVISYSILTALVVEQGRVIESQRGLIREMLIDSNQLAALKGKISQDENHARQKSQSGASGSTDQRKDSTSDPKASGKNGKRPAKPEHQSKEAPMQPESDLQDVRRMNRIL
ncbi:MAG: hypothetical protein WBS24_08835 [Terriglobales bacterium]